MSDSDASALRHREPEAEPERTKIRLVVIPDEKPAHRNVRTRAVKPSTIRVKHATHEERNRLRAEYPEAELPQWRPRTRADCADVPRPCPYVGCRFHLYLDVSDASGNIRVNFPDLEPGDLHPDESCSRDVAENEGSATLARVADLMNITRERARQIEEAALRKLALPASRLRK